MAKFSTERILAGIVENDRIVIQYVYDKYFLSIKSYVVKHGGDENDAWDVFQDSLMVVYEQAQSGDLILKNTFITYFYSVCKYKWLKNLRDSSPNQHEEFEYKTETELYGYNKYVVQLDEALEQEERVRLYQENFLKLSKECQKLFKLLAQGLTTNEITEELNYKSTGFTYKKRRLCKEQLLKRIKENNDNKLKL